MKSRQRRTTSFTNNFSVIIQQVGSRGISYQRERDEKNNIDKMQDGDTFLDNKIIVCILPKQEFISVIDVQWRRTEWSDFSCSCCKK